MEPTTPRHRCSAIAREQDEPLFGTAPHSQAWVLLEQPGAWGPDALTTSAIDPEVGAELNRLSKEHGFRIMLIRRGAGRSSGGARSCFLARSAQSETWMERLEMANPAELLTVDLDVLSRPLPPGLGEPAGPLWAICTHGRRDPCCAEYGRRLIRMWAENAVDDTCHGLWESSHQGGHRFAANLALFPHALFYGQIEVGNAQQIVDAYRDGRLTLDGYRGRSAFDGVTQAADYLVRRRENITGIDDLRPAGKADLGAGRYRVTFDSPSGEVGVLLEVDEGPLRPESCNKPKLTPSKIYRRLDVAPIGLPTA